MCLDIPSSSRTSRLCLPTILEHEPQHLGRVLNRGLSPDCTRRIWSHLVGQLDKLIANWKAIRNIHKVSCARPISRNHRLPKSHGVSDSQASTLGTMQGNIGVARSHHVPHLLGRPV